MVKEKKKKSYFCREKKINSEYLKDDFGPDHVKVNFSFDSLACST